MAADTRSIAVIDSIRQQVAIVDDALGQLKDRISEHARRDGAGLITAEDYTAAGIEAERLGAAIRAFAEVYGAMTPEQQAAFQLARK